MEKFELESQFARTVAVEPPRYVGPRQNDSTCIWSIDVLFVHISNTVSLDSPHTTITQCMELSCLASCTCIVGGGRIPTASYLKPEYQCLTRNLYACTFQMNDGRG